MIIDDLKSRQSKIQALYPSTNQEIYTPNFLVERILDRLPKKLWTNPDLKWCDSAAKSGEFMVAVIIRLMDGLKKKIPNEKKRYNHIIKNMVYGYSLTLSGAMVVRKTVYGDRNIMGNVSDKYFIEENKMKFDVIVGNPPYQAPVKEKAKKGGAGAQLWPEFVKKSLEYIKDGGYLAMIHPCMWRKPDAEMWPVLTQYQIEWIEMHRAIRGYGAPNDLREIGTDIFGVGTSFDCYVLHKVLYTKPTEVDDFSGKKYIIDLREWPWLPGAEFDLIKKILASDKDKKCEIISNYSYETRHLWMNEKKDKKFKYPCLHGIHQDGTIRYYYSSRNDKGHFNISKVIFGDGGYVYPFNDYKGEYGMTGHALAIPCSSKKESLLIYNALKSEKFKRVIWPTKWSNYETEGKMFKYFKKDFWKYFV